MTDYAVYQSIAVDGSGNTIGSASVEVRSEVSGNLVTLFSGRTGGALANPFTADSDGYFKFHTVGDFLKIRVYTGPSGAPTSERIFRYVPVGLAGGYDLDTVHRAVPDGTVALPSIAFASDSDTGFYRFTTNAIGAAVGGVLALTIAIAGLTVGPGGTGVTPQTLIIDGGSGSGGGVGLRLNKNSANLWALGHESWLAGSGVANNLYLHNYTTGSAAFIISAADNSASFGGPIATANASAGFVAGDRGGISNNSWTIYAQTSALRFFNTQANADRFTMAVNTGAASFICSAASALAVGPNAPTNPVFQVDASTASQVAGLKLTGAVTGGLVALQVIDSGSNASLTINAKGNGSIGSSSSWAFSSTSTVAFNVGPNGATNPVFLVDNSTASQAAGLKLTGAATGGTVALAAIDSGSNTNLSIDGKGSGTIGIAGTSTGNITIGAGGGTLLTRATNVASNTATPAGGSTAARLLFGTTANFGIYYGSGAPTVSAAAGSIYIRTDNAGANLRLYSNTTGATTWAAITSA